jgi:hypothetical protein
VKVRIDLVLSQMLDWELFYKTNISDGMRSVFLPQRAHQSFHLSERQLLDCSKHNTT